MIIEFDEEAPAVEFEHYLKTGSGREFARRHFRQRSSRVPNSTGLSPGDEDERLNELPRQ